MLSYRHGYHAGNAADVLKHLVLTALLRAATRKSTPLCYVETHAGAGRYDLDSGFARQRREHESGIRAVWAAAATAQAPVAASRAPQPAAVPATAPALICDYLAAVEGTAGNGPGAELRWYPGSPLFARHWLHAADPLWLAELHPADHAALAAALADVPAAHVRREDGYGLLKAVLPPKERRALVLIDPAYELDGERERIGEALREALRRMRHAVYAVWAPLRGKVDAGRLARDLARLHGGKLLRAALRSEDKRVLGSVMLVLNPPFRVEDDLREALAWLEEILPNVACAVDWVS